MPVFKRVLVGAVFTCFICLPSLSWSGDFNNDGMPDLIWQGDVFDSVAFWLMDPANPGEVLQACSIGAADQDIWDLNMIADMNNDQKDDLVWWNRNTSEIVIWYIDGCGFAIPAVDRGIKHKEVHYEDEKSFE